MSSRDSHSGHALATLSPAETALQPPNWLLEQKCVAGFSNWHCCLLAGDWVHGEQNGAISKCISSSCQSQAGQGHFEAEVLRARSNQPYI